MQKKISEDFANSQNSAFSNKTVDVLINSKMDNINKNVKSFSELIETKLINKISKLEELCNSKFISLSALSGKMESMELSVKSLPLSEDITTMSKQLTDRLDNLEEKYKTLEDKFSLQSVILSEILQKFESLEKLVYKSLVDVNIKLDNFKKESQLVDETSTPIMEIEFESEPIQLADVENVPSADKSSTPTPPIDIVESVSESFPKKNKKDKKSKRK